MELYEKVLQWMKIAIAFLVLVLLWVIANILEEILKTNIEILEALIK